MSSLGRPELPPLEIAGRLEGLRERMRSERWEAMLVTNLTNIRYLTGFTGSAGIMLVLPEEVLLVTDGRYGEQARDQLSSAAVEARIEVTNQKQKEVVSQAASGIDRLALEAEAVSWSQQLKLAAEWFPDADLVPTEQVVEELRRRKDAGEVARVEAAARIADAALAEVRQRLSDELSERDFALELDFTMRRLGADDVSFETIVASGPNGAKPHARPSERRMTEGDLVVVDFGALLDGYHSDMTRTFVLGDPSPTQARMLEVVMEAQRAGVEAVAAGVECRAVDAASRKVIEDAGWGEAFLHSTGHGVGLEIHEMPRVAKTSEAVLAEGEIVTVEPGVYLSDHGGVRIEDTVVVQRAGCRTLTSAPKLTTVS